MTSPFAKADSPKAKASPKLLVGVAIILGLLMVAVVIFSHRGLYQIYRFRHERVRLDQENARLAEENARLTRTIDRLQHDPEMIQEVIRRELNFVKKNEIIFQLPPGRETQKSVSSPLSKAAPVDESSAPPGGQSEAGKGYWSLPFLEGAPQSGSKTAH